MGRRTSRARRLGAVLPAAALLLAACGTSGAESTNTISADPRERRLTELPVGPSSGSTMIPDGPSSSPAAPGAPRLVEIVTTRLTTPWGLDFFPNGDALVTERDTGRVLRITGKRRVVQEVGTLAAVSAGGEAGALGLEISPFFSEGVRWVYFYLSTAEDNRIVRAGLEGGVLDDPEVLLDGIPRGFVHNGGRLAFGPDDLLYIGTGDTGDPALAQDPDSLAGKILRLTPEGEPAPGNPFDSPVYSLGHHDVQGLAFDGQDRLWATDVGDEEADELNLVEAGGNFGWPDIEGDADEDEVVRKGEDFLDPQLAWPPDEAAPSGLALAGGDLWMSGLDSRRLTRIELADGRAVDPQPFAVKSYGRLRTAATAPDGSLWVATSNRDRGDPVKADDRILRFIP